MGKLDRLQDDFSTLDTDKWPISEGASVSSSTKIDLLAKTVKTTLLCDCDKPVIAIELPMTELDSPGVIVHRISVECSCGRINTWEGVR